jgi:surfeit locus 1 family protein
MQSGPRGAFTVPRIDLGRRVFQPSWLMTAGVILLLVAFVNLGRWQWHRGLEKQALWEAFARGTDSPQALGSKELDAFARYAHVSITGRYEPAHQFLLDNRTQQGRAGYEALAPLVLDDGRTILVDRGWLPFAGVRGALPELRFDPPPHSIVTGRLDQLPARGLAAGHAAPAAGPDWPKLTSWPTTPELEAALGRPLARRIVLLDGREPFGFIRNWQPPGVPPGRHLSYAIQWWLFAVVALGLYLFLNLRERREPPA